MAGGRTKLTLRSGGEQCQRNFYRSSDTSSACFGSSSMLASMIVVKPSTDANVAAVSLLLPEEVTSAREPSGVVGWIVNLRTNRRRAPCFQ
jgi:hypothetical protein